MQISKFAHKLPPKVVRGRRGDLGRKVSGKEVANRGEREEEGTEWSSWNAACTVSAAKPNELAKPHTQMAYYIVLKLSQYCN